VRRWAAEPPEWFEIHDVVVPEDSSLGDIDQGEAEAITLAIQLGAQTLLLIDDQDGRLVAQKRGQGHSRGRGATMGVGPA
jgi:predicted nucleic acid-binding protein